MKLRQVIIPRCVRGFPSEAALFDVQIANGVVASIEPCAAAGGALASGTLLPALVDMHVHLDKTHVVELTGSCDGDLFRAIDLMAAHRASWSIDDIGARMETALKQAFACGTRAMRTHLDWVEAGPPQSLDAFERLRDAWRGRIDLQCVSLTPLDLFDVADPALAGAGEAISARLAKLNAASCGSSAPSALLGAFVYRNARLREKLQHVFHVAARHNLALDFHVDEGLDADADGLRQIAELTIANGYQGRVTCGHACSLAMQPRAQAEGTLRLCALAGIHLISLPTTNLYLQGDWGDTPVERGVTRLMEARRLEVSTSIATDNVADGFYPYGSYDLLESYALGVQVAHLHPADEWLDCVTTHPAQAMGLQWTGRIAQGCPADLVLLRARSRFELLTPQGRMRRVIRNGAMIED